MPTIVRSGPYRLFFYSQRRRRATPLYVHVRRDRRTAKFWLDPLALATSNGFAEHELSRCIGSSRANWGDAVRARAVRATHDRLIVELDDDRTLSIPLWWYPRLLRATDAERAQWQLIGGGEGIHWPLIDEDLSVEGMLRGWKAHGATPDGTAAQGARTLLERQNGLRDIGSHCDRSVTRNSDNPVHRPPPGVDRIRSESNPVAVAHLINGQHRRRRRVVGFSRSQGGATEPNAEPCQ